MKKNILVCGATGFIGRNVAETLAKNPDYNVFGTHFKRPSIEGAGVQYVYADLTNPENVSSVLKDIDIVVQAAAITTGSKDVIERPYIHVTDNAVMNSLILRECFEKHVSHFVFFSCTVMYQTEKNPVIETPLLEDDFNPSEEIHSKYFGVAWTKVYIEKMCEFYPRLGRTKHTVIRHSNIYGPYDKYDLEHSHVFGATITKVMTAEKDSVTVWGEGNEARDLLYVDDLVNLVDRSISMQEKPFVLVNVGCGAAIKVKDLVGKIIEISGKRLQLLFDKSQPSIETSLQLNCSKAKSEFSWEPLISLDVGINKTIKWYKENIK